MARNPHWYNLNEQRPWPLDDTALLTADNGIFLPHDILADLYLRFPSSLGDRVFLGSLTISPGVVTCTFLSASSGYTPVASVSLPRPVDPYRHYNLETIYPGVAGWIVFGSGIDQKLLRSYRFTSPLQSLIQLQSARKYAPRPLSSMGKLNVASELTGIVHLSAGNDLEIVKEDREIEGVIQEAVVIRLVGNPSLPDRNVLDLYRGPCGRRPESRNCGDPEPIEFINNVGPDCCGNIIIEFRGCVAISKDVDSCNVILDCGFGLGAACPTGDRLPDATGRLPNEYDDLCEDAIEISLDVSDEEEPVREFVSIPSGDGDTMTSLPVVVTFDDGTTGAMSTVRGDVTVITNPDLSEKVASFSDGGGVNLLLFDSTSVTAEAGWTSFYKNITAEAILTAGDIGSLRNAGIVVNYRATTYDPATFVYWLVDFSWDDARKFRVLSFDGATFVPLAETTVPGVALDNRYELTVIIQPVSATSDDAWITATLVGVDDAVTESLGPVHIPNYRPAEGTVGLFSNRSATQYTHIVLDNYPVV